MHSNLLMFFKVFELILQHRRQIRIIACLHHFLHMHNNDPQTYYHCDSFYFL